MSYRPLADCLANFRRGDGTSTKIHSSPRAAPRRRPRPAPSLHLMWRCGQMLSPLRLAPSDATKPLAAGARRVVFLYAGSQNTCQKAAGVRHVSVFFKIGAAASAAADGVVRRSRQRVWGRCGESLLRRAGRDVRAPCGGARDRCGRRRLRAAHSPTGHGHPGARLAHVDVLLERLARSGDDANFNSGIDDDVGAAAQEEQDLKCFGGAACRTFPFEVQVGRPHFFDGSGEGGSRRPSVSRRASSSPTPGPSSRPASMHPRRAPSARRSRPSTAGRRRSPRRAGRGPSPRRAPSTRVTRAPQGGSSAPRRETVGAAGGPGRRADDPRERLPPVRVRGPADGYDGWRRLRYRLRTPAPVTIAGKTLALSLANSQSAWMPLQDARAAYRWAE